MASAEYVPIIIYCTECGNRSMRNALNGELREGVIHAPRSFIKEVKKSTCIYCGGAMDARIVEDDDGSADWTQH